MNVTPRLPLQLTNREMDVLCGIVEGLEDQEIAERLGVSHHTIKTFGNRVRAKLGATNRTQTAVYALQYGLVEMDGSTEDVTAER